MEHHLGGWNASPRDGAFKRTHSGARRGDAADRDRFARLHAASHHLHVWRNPKMSWNPYDNLPPAASFSLISSDLRESGKLAVPQVSGIFGAGDGEVSPPLSCGGFPRVTKSFVIASVSPE